MPYAAINLVPPDYPIGLLIWDGGSVPGDNGPTENLFYFTPSLFATKITNSGRVLLQYDSGLPSSPAGYVWYAGIFQSLQATPDWAEFPEVPAPGDLRYPDQTRGEFESAIADMNDSGVVVGYTNRGEPKLTGNASGPLGGQYWPQSLVASAGVTIASQNLPSTADQMPEFIDDTGKIYGPSYDEDPPTTAIWNNVTSSPILNSSRAIVPVAISSSGHHMISRGTDDIGEPASDYYYDSQLLSYAYFNKTTGGQQYNALPVGINESGRYLPGAQNYKSYDDDENLIGTYQIQSPTYADGLGAPTAISSLLSSVDTALGINNNFDILVQTGATNWSIFTWTATGPASESSPAGPGSYTNNVLNITTQDGWTIATLGTFVNSSSLATTSSWGASSIGTVMNDSRELIGTTTNNIATVPAVLVPCALLVDANRDGLIDNNDVGATSAAIPFRFWLNDDHDNGNQNVPDYTTGVVNGQSDLKDFFPLVLMIQGLVSALPPGQYSYVLKQADGALNFTYTNLNANNAYSYLTSKASTGFGTGLIQPAASAAVTQITATGVTLDSAFLNQVQGQGGVILVEANAITTNPVVLEIHDSVGVTVAALNLWFSSAFNMQMELLNGTTTDFDGSVVSNIIPPPENPQYANDVATEGGITVLGPVTMGQGRVEAPNYVYTAPIMAAVQAPLTIVGIQYKWERLLTRRSWYIKKQTAADGTISWNVTQRSSRGTVTPANDIDPGYFGNTTPSSLKKEFYEYDDSALGYGNFPNDRATGFMNPGDYIHEEKAFTYEMQISFDGINWHTQLEMPVAQTITIMYQATGGTAATDWVGVPNLVNGNTNLNQTIVPTITVAKVSAIVEPIGSVNIDPAANN